MAVNRRHRDNTMAEIKRTKGNTIINKTFDRNIQIK